jgi:hypothetical protein
MGNEGKKIQIDSLDKHIERWRIEREV